MFELFNTLYTNVKKSFRIFFKFEVTKILVHQARKIWKFIQKSYVLPA